MYYVVHYYRKALSAIGLRIAEEIGILSGFIGMSIFALDPGVKGRETTRDNDTYHASANGSFRTLDVAPSP